MLSYLTGGAGTGPAYDLDGVPKLQKLMCQQLIKQESGMGSGPALVGADFSRLGLMARCRLAATLI